MLDFTNGAAVATYAGLKTVARQGFSCRAICGSRMDSWEGQVVEEVFTRQGIEFDVFDVQIDGRQAQVVCQAGRLPGDGVQERVDTGRLE